MFKRCYCKNPCDWAKALSYLSLLLVLLLNNTDFAFAEDKKTMTLVELQNERPVFMLNTGYNGTLDQLYSLFDLTKYNPDFKEELLEKKDLQKMFIDEWVSMTVLSELAKKEELDKSEEYISEKYVTDTKYLAGMYIRKYISPVLEKIKATPEDVDAYYNTHKEEFFSGWRKVRKEAFDDKAKADEFYEKFINRKGEASDLSSFFTNPSIIVYKGNEAVAPDLEAVVFETPKETAVKPVQSGDKWYFLYVETVSDADYQPLDDDVRKVILATVQADLKKQAYENIVSGLKTSLGAPLEIVIDENTASFFSSLKQNQKEDGKR